MKTLLGSYLVTTLCGWTLAFLIPLYVLELTQSATWTALTYFTAMAPYILVTPFAGVWSDRYHKKNFLIAGDASSVLVAGAIYLALGMMSGSLLVGSLIVLNFALASISATNHPMFQSFAPEILKSEQLTKFNSLVNAVDNIVRIFAPLFVAGLLSFVEKKTILVACASGFFISLPLLMLIRTAPTARKVQQGVLRELGDGVKYVLADKNLISFSLLFFFVNFGLALIGSNLIFIFSSIFAVPQQDVGYYYGIIGAGAVVGSLVAPKVVGTIEDASLIILCCAAAGLLALLACFATTPLSMSLIWAASTAAQSLVVVTFFTFRQRVVPKEILGRTVGVTRLISYLAIPPASVLGGMLMDSTHSLSVIMASGGISIILGALVSLRAPAFRQHKQAAKESLIQ